MIDLKLCKKNITSQCGENGIFAAIFQTIGTTNRFVVDIGAFDLKTLSNVYPLWNDEGWSALLVEANPVYYRRMCKGRVPSTVRLLNVAVAPEGENSLDAVLRRGGAPASPDLLSIDIDGVDYHVWASLTDHHPRVVVIEYNPTVPAHLVVIGEKTGNRVGASARALCELAASKGYTLVVCTETNLVFVESRDAEKFRDAGDLDRLFDPYAVNYVMSDYDGGLFYSNELFPFGRGKSVVRVIRRNWVKPVVTAVLGLVGGSARRGD